VGSSLCGDVKLLWGDDWDDWDEKDLHHRLNFSAPNFDYKKYNKLNVTF